MRHFFLAAVLFVVALLATHFVVVDSIVDSTKSSIQNKLSEFELSLYRRELTAAVTPLAASSSLRYHLERKDQRAAESFLLGGQSDNVLVVMIGPDCQQTWPRQELSSEDTELCKKARALQKSMFSKDGLNKIELIKGTQWQMLGTLRNTRTLTFAKDAFDSKDHWPVLLAAILAILALGMVRYDHARAINHLRAQLQAMEYWHLPVGFRSSGEDEVKSERSARNDENEEAWAEDPEMSSFKEQLSVLLNENDNLFREQQTTIKSHAPERLPTLLAVRTELSRWYELAQGSYPWRHFRHLSEKPGSPNLLSDHLSQLVSFCDKSNYSFDQLQKLVIEEAERTKLWRQLLGFWHRWLTVPSSNAELSDVCSELKCLIALGGWSPKVRMQGDFYSYEGSATVHTRLLPVFWHTIRAMVLCNNDDKDIIDVKMRLDSSKNYLYASLSLQTDQPATALVRESESEFKTAQRLAVTISDSMFRKIDTDQEKLTVLIGAPVTIQTASSNTSENKVNKLLESQI